MHLWLVRHGKAEDREHWPEDDAARPLTKAGLAQARRVFQLLDGWLAADQVWTSPYVRARQTAELAAAAWRLPLREQDSLAPDAAAPSALAARLDRRLDLVLVGHEPDLGVFAGWLTGGRAMSLKKAGLCHLEGEPTRGGMELRALLPPKLVLGLAGDA